MDPKRPDVRLEEKPDEEGVVTRWDGGDDDQTLFERLRQFLDR